MKHINIELKLKISWWRADGDAIPEGVSTWLAEEAEKQIRRQMSVGASGGGLITDADGGYNLITYKGVWHLERGD